MNKTRGSQWRIWDLHVHTPLSIEQNYGGDSPEVWERYISDLESLPTEIKVLGINDYIFIDGYKKVLEYKKSGRLANIDLILPVVELRLAKFAGNEKFKRINYHIIFSDEVDADIIQSQFLNALTAQYKISPEYSTLTWGGVITRENLISLGQQIINSVPEEERSKFSSPIVEGFNNLNLSEEGITNALKNAKQYFDSKYITAIGKTEWDAIKWDDNTIAEKKTLINSVDVVFTAAKDVESFNKAKQKLKDAKVNDLLLDCSDAHTFSHQTDIKDRIGHCRTWIKANTTFEGLKQILFEPDDRVVISDMHPDQKFDYNIIDYIELNKAGTWNQRIYLNPSLNSIIGGRSTGKSNLLSAVAARFHSVHDRPINSYARTLADSVRVVWRDKQELYTKDIEYIPQDYMNKIASDVSECDKLFMSILLSSDEKRQANDDYHTSISELKVSIQSLISKFFEIRRLLEEKKKRIREIGDSEGIRRELSKLETDKKSIQASLSGDVDAIRNFETLSIKTNSIIEQNRKIQTEISAIAELIINNPIDVTFSHKYDDNISEEHALQIKDLISRIKIEAQSKTDDLLKNIKDNLNHLLEDNKKQIEEIKSSPDYQKGAALVEANKFLVDLDNKIKIQQSLIKSIENEEKELNRLKENCRTVYNEIIENHLIYIHKINSLASSMRIQHDDIILESEIIVSPELRTSLEECLNLRGAEMNEIIDSFCKGYNTLLRENIKSQLQTLITNALQNKLSYKGGYNAESFLNRILATNWLILTLQVTYEGDGFKDMSPGKRSLVILKLILDFSNKKCPILIDQPEDNLDNRAIYRDLVNYIRKKKVQRQIILVTHNPNIVVGADSELVIVANQKGKDSPNRDGIKFQYLSESLEDTHFHNYSEDTPTLERYGIREHVCDILEGGRQAFERREMKYGFKR